MTLVENHELFKGRNKTGLISKGEKVYLGKGTTKMITFLNRMCWNSCGWRLPTNSSADGGYPSIMGFGHEEWNFQIEDAVDGLIYGYLYFKKPADEIIEQAEGHFRIGFWSFHPDTREKLLVGLYNDAELSSKDDIYRVNQHFASMNIYER